ncbi:MAG: response regulator [Phormidesmis sp.]
MITALIVEDSLTDRDLLTCYLQQSGVTVTSVQNSEEALKVLRSAQPDLLFLDVVLPGQSGFELCRDLKTEESTQNIPVIICSTKDTEADKLWGSMLGADAYLTKPVDQQQLSKTVEKLVGYQGAVPG